MKFGMSLWYALGRFEFEFLKNQMGIGIIVTSFKSSPNNCQYLKFYSNNFKVCAMCMIFDVFI